MPLWIHVHGDVHTIQGSPIHCSTLVYWPSFLLTYLAMELIPGDSFFKCLCYSAVPRGCLGLAVAGLKLKKILKTSHYALPRITMELLVTQGPRGAASVLCQSAVEIFLIVEGSTLGRYFMFKVPKAVVLVMALPSFDSHNRSVEAKAATLSTPPSSPCLKPFESPGSKSPAKDPWEIRAWTRRLRRFGHSSSPVATEERGRPILCHSQSMEQVAHFVSLAAQPGIGPWLSRLGLLVSPSLACAALAWVHTLLAAWVLIPVSPVSSVATSASFSETPHLDPDLALGLGTIGSSSALVASMLGTFALPWKLTAVPSLGHWMSHSTVASCLRNTLFACIILVYTVHREAWVPMAQILVTKRTRDGATSPTSKHKAKLD